MLVARDGDGDCGGEEANTAATDDRTAGTTPNKANQPNACLMDAHPFYADVALPFGLYGARSQRERFDLYDTAVRQAPDEIPDESDAGKVVALVEARATLP